MCRYSYNDNATYCAYLPGVAILSFILPNKDGTFSVGVGNSVQIIKWDGKSKLATFVSKQFSLSENGTAVLYGYTRNSRFYVGTLAATLCITKDYSQFGAYRYDNQSSLVNILKGSNVDGITFDLEKNILYLLASCRLYITSYDWNPKTGDICKDVFILLKNLNIID